MPKTLTIKLDTELSINFNTWDLCDAEQASGNQAMQLIVNNLLKQNEVDEVEKIDNNSNPLSETMTRVMKAKKSYLTPLVVHASECHKLMTNPRRKSDELSETTKTWLKEKAVEAVLGFRKNITTKPMIKGTVCEDN